MAKTLGQLADEGAPLAEVFDCVRRLCEARGWIPVGFRRIELPDGFVVTVNGTTDERKDDEGMDIPPFHCSVWRNGWPCGTYTMFGGVFVGGTEDLLIAAFNQALGEAQDAEASNG